jgi:DNA polymerase-1
MLILRAHDVSVTPLLFDSMLASYVLDSTQSHGMDALSERFLGYRPISITELIGSRGKGQLNMRDVDTDIVGEYASEDADVTLQLYTRLDRELREQGLIEVAERYEFPLVEVLATMEYCGVKIDVRRSRTFRRAWRRRRRSWKRRSTSWPGGRSTSARRNSLRRSSSIS